MDYFDETTSAIDFEIHHKSHVSNTSTESTLESFSGGGDGSNSFNASNFRDESHRSSLVSEASGRRSDPSKKKKKKKNSKKKKRRSTKTKELGLSAPDLWDAAEAKTAEANTNHDSWSEWAGNEKLFPDQQEDALGGCYAYLQYAITSH